MRDVFVLILFFWFTSLWAQEPLTYKDYHQKFQNTIFKNSDSALYYVNRIKLDENSFKKTLPSYYYHQDLGQYYFFIGKLDSSQRHYKKAYTISSNAGLDSLAIDSNIWLANHEYFKGEMQKSNLRYERILENSKKADYLEGVTNAYGMFASLEPDLSKKMNLYLKVDSLYKVNKKQSSLLARVYASIAGIYLEAKGHNDLAKYYINKCLEISKKVAYPPGEYEANRLQIKLAVQEQKYDKGILLYKELLQQGIINNDPTAKDVATLGLARMYLKKDDLIKAEEQLKKGLYLLNRSTKSLILGEAHLHWAEYYLKLNKPEMALSHLKEARLNPDLTDTYGYNTELNRIEIKYYEAVKDFTKAYQLKVDYDQKIEFLNQQQNADGFILDEQLKFREKKQQELELLKTQYKLAEEQKKGQKNLFLSGIGLTSLALILLFVLYKNRIKTNKKLRDIDTLKTDFFTNISHEFRTPLTLISVPIQDTLDNPDLSFEKRKHFEIAQKNTKRLSSLVNQLLELSKIDSGNRKLLLQKNKPSQLIAAWCDSFLYLAKQKKINFKTEILNKERIAWFDGEALENITINLLGNAIKYTPNEGEINLKVSIENDYLNIEIKNTGQGLTGAQIKTIFNRFYQTDGQNEGSGVGLSLVKELTGLHGGKINVSSEVHKWSLFEISLCLDKNKLKNFEIIEISDDNSSTTAIDFVEEEHQEESTAYRNELPMLLIVEDNADVRTLLTDTFKGDYEVIQAVNGEEGISLALYKIPDIIISDLMMPKKDGIELTRTLKNDERTSHIPIILLTAKAGDKNELTGIRVGADDYITKPFNQKILKSKTASLVTLRKKLQSRYSQEVILKPKDIAISSIDEKFLDKVQKILDEKLVDSTFNTNDFSKAVHMSRMQLHRKLKALTGLSSSEFIRSQRLKLAAQILKTSDINISEVGYSVGFNDHAYFSKCFKEIYNCSPTSYAGYRKNP